MLKMKPLYEMKPAAERLRPDEKKQFQDGGVPVKGGDGMSNVLTGVI